MAAILNLIPWLGIHALQSIRAGEIPLHLPAFFLYLSLHFIILYHLNRGLAIPLILYSPDQTMIRSGLYYRNSIWAGLASLSLLSLMNDALILLYPDSALRTDRIILLWIFTGLYTLFAILYNAWKYSESEASTFPGGLQAILNPTRLFTSVTIANLCLLFGILNRKLGQGGSLSISPQLLTDSLNFVISYFAPKLFFWFVLAFAGTLIMLSRIFRMDADIRTTRRILAFYLEASALFLVYNSLISAQQLVATRSTLFMLFASDSLFLILVSLLARLLSGRSDAAESLKDAEDIHFNDERMHARIVYVAATIILAAALYMAAGLAAALLLAVVLILPLLARKRAS